MLEHIDYPKMLLCQLSEFFGYLYVEVPDYLDSDQLAMAKRVLSSGPLWTDDDHVWEFTRQSIRSLIISTSWSILDEEYFGGVSRFWCANSRPFFALREEIG